MKNSGIQRKGAKRVKQNSNSAKDRYENVLMYVDDSNPLRNSNQGFKPNNVGPMTTDPLEKVLQSINVFPIVNIHLLENNLKDLLTCDSNDDSSQISQALHGNLAKEIVNTIFNEISDDKDKELQKMMNYGLPNNSKCLNSLKHKNLDNRRSDYKTSNSDTIEKAACRSLTSDFHDFLQWLLDIENSSEMTDEATKENTYSNDDLGGNLNDWHLKAKIIKHLLDEYKLLSKTDKTKLQSLHEYLVNRYEFVKHYM
ncbi:PREDICTED: uncharacterized protein LOC105361171, partial [Ceratosolen solmsi marchali]|uniref:Uncharacterized protein LOC105361171 n=1 Tax=Ceratosolen solmsi marchali TaxID=326594 RepID=A0AAJ6YEH2_9HYME